jgi:hypothetical protein
MDTAGVTTMLIRHRLQPVRVAVVAAVVATAFAGCGGDTVRAYQIGEGSPDRSGYDLAYAEGGGLDGIGTPTTAVEQWGAGCRQLFGGGRSGTAALLQQPCGENRQVFAVTGDFWEVYRRAGEMAMVKYGFPIGRLGEWKQGWTQGFGHGGVFSTFFMQRPGEPPHTLTMPMLEYFLSFEDRDVRFGYPTTELVVRGTGLCQVFEHAVVTARNAGTHVSFEVFPGDATPEGRCS